MTCYSPLSSSLPILPLLKLRAAFHTNRSIHWHHQLHTLLVHLLPVWQIPPNLHLTRSPSRLGARSQSFNPIQVPTWSDHPLPSPSSWYTAGYLHQSHHSHHSTSVVSHVSTPTLSSSANETLIRTFITSRLHYCSSFLSVLPSTVLQKLQFV